MKILARSVMDSFLTALLLSFIVISMVLTVGLLMPVAGYFMRGAEAAYLWRMVLVGFHESLQLTVPIAVFFASVFVFARLKEDGEMDAMRACGIRLRSVAWGPLVVAALLSGLFLWMDCELIPREHEMRRRIKNALFMSSGFKLLTPGETANEIPHLRLRFDDREDDTLVGLIAQDSSDPRVTRLLTAGRARMSGDRKRPSLELDRMTLEPLDAEKKLRLRAEHLQYKLQRDLRRFRYRRTEKDMTMAELVVYAKGFDDKVAMLDRPPPSNLPPLSEELKEISRRARNEWLARAASVRVEFGRRIVYALAPFCFVFLGVALGVRARRGGFVRTAAIALAVLLGYFLHVLTMIALADMPALHPEVFVYLPPVVALIAGWWLWRKL